MTRGLFIGYFSDRVIDELHPERHFTNDDIVSLMAVMVSP